MRTPDRRAVRPGMAVVAAMLFGAAGADAQTGTIQGVVRDTDGAVPELAFVRVLGREGGTPVSGPEGGFELALPQGAYSLVAESPGYRQKRLDDVEVVAGEVTDVTITIESFTSLLDQPNVTTEPWRSEATSSSPARVSIVSGEQARDWGGPTLVGSLQGLPGIDVAQTGLTPSNVVSRGFNNVFSGSLLVLSDYRYTRLPSLRFNAYNMIPATAFDVDRIELVLGPAAALYGPNSANGVVHVVTSSPIDRPGADLSVSAGDRESFQGAFRAAARLGEGVGVKLSGQLFRGREWEYVDPVEQDNASEDTPLIGNRDLDTERFSGDARIDFRPWGPDGGEIILSGGMNVIDGIELTPLGAAQAEDWRYQYGHVRLERNGFFAQAFLNQTNAEDTRLLRSGTLIVDRSRTMAAQTRYTFASGEGQEWVAGVDVQRTEPRTGGTIMGENEDDDVIREIGAYLHSRTALSTQVDFVAAVRVDKHDRLEDVNVSPRLAFLFTPAEGQNFRLTYNRAFNTPTTNNLFLDLVAGRIPLGGGLGYDVRAVGTPSTGFTYEEPCEGGVGDLCMYSTFAAGRIAADGGEVWDELLSFLSAADPTFADLAPLLMNPGADSNDPVLASGLLGFDQEAEEFLPTGLPEAIDPLRSTITNTIELGYKGLIADKLSISADVYSTSITDFVGPLRVETPSVFLTPRSVEEFVRHRLASQLEAGTVTDEDIAGIVQGITSIPTGTVTPDQRSGTDVLVVSRNFGDVNLWGADLGFELHATDEVTVTGSVSFVSESCFDFSEDDPCGSRADITLNAPSSKGSVGVRYESAYSPITLGARMRHTGSFPMNSGAFVGDVEAYTLFDAHVGWTLPQISGAKLSIVAKNLLDTKHQEFVGAPVLGRLAFVRLTYSF